MSKHTDEQVLDAVARYLSDSVYQHVNDRFEQRAALLEALSALFADYKALADSGDSGNWRLEDIAVGKQALAAIALAQGDAA